MRMRAGGCWLAVGLWLGCAPPPAEVSGASRGDGSTTEPGTSDGPSDEAGPGSTGPVAEGSADSGSATLPTGGDSGTTEPVDPTSEPSTSSGEPPESTGPGSTTQPDDDDEGEDDEPPPPPPPLSCDELFGTADGYLLCSHDESSCTFNANLNGANCTAICAMFGQTCLDALDNPGFGGNACEIQGDYDCNVGGKDTLLCVCDRPS